MAVEFESKFVFGEFLDDPIVEQVYLVVMYIKAKDFYMAQQIMIQNNFSFENIISKTQTLKHDEFVKFVDYIVSQKV